jgi:hypothetical protein
MADESTERHDSSPGPSGQPPRGGETNKAGRDSNRRRVIITSLLTPPAVMTLNARRAAAAVASAETPSMKNPGKYHK